MVKQLANLDWLLDLVKDTGLKDILTKMLQQNLNQDVSTDKDTSEIQQFLCSARFVIQVLLLLENLSDADLNLLAQAF
jgi:hypothetical protein